MRTLVPAAALCLALAGLGQPLRAERIAGDALLDTFATCAGRLSAQMEYEWMFDGPAAERTGAQRAAMVALLAAILPEGRGPEVLARRISAKAAHSALLTRATFGDDPHAGWAARRAEVLVAECTALLLG